MSILLSRAEAALSGADSFVLPELVLHFYSNKTPVLLAPPKRISLDKVEALKDALALYSGGKRFLLAVNPAEHVAVRLQTGDVSALSVTVDSLEEDFSDSLINGALNKIWLYNVYAHSMLRRFGQASEPLLVSSHGTRRHVADCPRQMRVYQGKPYANLDIDCRGCEYCIDLTEPNFLYCSGRSRVLLPEDFNKPPAERTALYPELAAPAKTEQVQAGVCPLCGGKLVERKGQTGKFLSCSRYPFCRFSANFIRGGIAFTVSPPEDENNL